MIKKAIGCCICCVLSIAVIAQTGIRPNIIGPGTVQVNSYTGNMFCQRTDMQLRGRLPINIFFSYNSSDYNVNRGYGRGWIFNYSMQVVEKSDTAVVIWNDGREDIYLPNAVNPGVLLPPKGIFDSLKKISGSYTLRTPDGSKYFFNNPVHKKLTSIEDRNGNALTFSYNDSLVSGITDAAGRSVQLFYTAGKLSSIVEANGSPSRTWTYQYDDAGNLKKVKDPLGFTNEYGSIINGPINVVKDKNGTAVDIIYDANFAVKEIISCLTKQTITYGITNNTTYLAELVGSTNQLTVFTFDALGKLVQKSGNCCGYNVKYEYDNDNNLSRLTDANGNVYTYTYDGRGNLLSETDPLNHTISYTYEPVYNELTKRKDKNGNSILYGYDAHGNLLQKTYPTGILETKTYAANGDLLTATDGRNNTVTYTYDTYGDTTVVSKPLGAVYNYTYNSKGWQLTAKDALNHTSSFAYDSLGRMLTQTDALNQVTAYSYDHVGNVVKYTDPANHSTIKQYDALSRLVKLTNALGKSKSMNYDAKTNLISMTDENNHTTTYSYDERGRRSAEINALGETTAYSHDGNGNIVLMMFPDGQQLSMTYDLVNRLTNTSDQTGTLETYTYDNNDNQLTVTDGNGNTTSFAYDALDRVKTETDAAGNSYTYTYDANANILTETNRDGNMTTYTYDAQNRQTGAQDALNHTTVYGYDAQGNMTSVKDAGNHTTSYSYDALNRNNGITYANGSSKTYTYDASGNVLSRTDASGNTTNYVYDSTNHLVKRDFPGTNDDVYSYDNAGQMLTAVNNNATVSFTYDATGRKTSEQLNGKTTGYQYNVAARKTIIQYPAGRNIERNLDTRSELTTIKEGAGVLAAFNYDVAGRNTGITYKNGITSVIAYDAVDRVSSILSNPGGFQNMTNTYDAEGNKLLERKMNSSLHSEAYSYDSKDRLSQFKRGSVSGTSIPSPVAQSSYAYDAVGNRSTATVNGLQTSYTSNSVNEYSGISNTQTTFTALYDSNGNISFDGTYNYAYDAQQRLLLVNNGAVSSYLYDALDRRIKKTEGSTAINYYYDDLQVIEERDNADSVKASYVYGNTLDGPVSMSRGNKKYYYHYNSTGSVYAISDSAGKIVEQYEYSPFGDMTIFDSSQNIITSSLVANTTTFTGRDYDAETNNYHYRYRSYNLRTARFNQRDPLELHADISLYSYADNNPVNYTDPLGLQTGKAQLPPPPPETKQQVAQREQHKKLGKEVEANQKETKKKIEEEQAIRCQANPCDCKSNKFHLRSRAVSLGSRG